MISPTLANNYSKMEGQNDSNTFDHQQETAAHA